MDKKPKGILYLAATSLGCDADIPSRSLELLRTATLPIFEEAKVARQFLKAAGVHREFLCLSEHKNEATLEDARMTLLSGGSVVYMSDQGTPGFADPGIDLVRMAFQEGCNVRVVPGPSSVAGAIAACPFSCERFTFYGFLKRDTNERRIEIERFKSHAWPIILLDTPYRLKAVIEDCGAVLGSEAKAFLALEIGNEDQAYYFESFAALLKRIDNVKRQNFVLIIQRA